MSNEFSPEMLPALFKERMKAELGYEYDDFIKSYEKPYRSALRINTLKFGGDELRNTINELYAADVDSAKEIIEEELGCKLEPVPWAKNGFYYDDTARPGKHPMHDAGLYYIQEPSAMRVATVGFDDNVILQDAAFTDAMANASSKDAFDNKNEFQQGTSGVLKVLDLCAAPGGKTTAIADFMQGEGVLVANEIHPSRAKILSSNVERMGITNCFVTNETPENLAQHFPGFFNKIFVDAPCSGEGMFRKEEDAIKCWSQENINLCAARQKDILQEAVKMLAPGGTLIYSTCTFAREEDEEIVKWLEKDLQLSCTYQEKMLPHQVDGEGHFIAVLVDKSVWSDAGKNIKTKRKQVRCSFNADLVDDFLNEVLRKEVKENLSLGKELISYGDNIYLAPSNVNLKGLKCLRPGLQLGKITTAKRSGEQRFTPAHAFALALHADEIEGYFMDLAATDAQRYLAGETIDANDSPSNIDDIMSEMGLSFKNYSFVVEGWVLFTICGVSLGWGKANDNIIKNHLPKGLRHN